jgi:hypothetical protein
LKAEAFLARCDKARRTGADSWIACCPAHGDKTPSMTVRELEDGRVLIHCFSGCSAEEILGAVGMTFDALFPDRLPSGKEYSPGLRRPFPASDVIEALSGEALLVAVAAYNIAHGIELDAGDRERLLAAYGRIAAGRRLALGIR